jgi:hypothetical protein
MGTTDVTTVSNHHIHARKHHGHLNKYRNLYEKDKLLLQENM